MGETAATGEDFVRAVMPAIDLLHNLARRLVHRPVEAQDLAQDTLVKAWQAWARGVRPDPVGPWLSTICLNLARDRARRDARRPEVFSLEDVDRSSPFDVEAEAIKRVQRTQIARALWTLPEAQRIAVTLVDICGLTAAEAAVITGSPRGTVLSRIRRGREALFRAVHTQLPRGPAEDPAGASSADPAPGAGQAGPRRRSIRPRAAGKNGGPRP
ncbi:MAG: RNA polymerase sigma factor [Sporichthyaceae bacterium]